MIIALLFLIDFWKKMYSYCIRLNVRDFLKIFRVFCWSWPPDIKTTPPPQRKVYLAICMHAQNLWTRQSKNGSTDLIYVFGKIKLLIQSYASSNFFWYWWSFFEKTKQSFAALYFVATTCGWIFESENYLCILIIIWIASRS